MRVTAQVLTSLTRKRPVGSPRESFFGYADAFAMLVRLEAVPMDGGAGTGVEGRRAEGGGPCAVRWFE